ncbi:MAG: amidohydrolase family protein [Acidobacteria bacterium]|nr:amidohydrolase family protein [Acidobacteriota bacterium]
MKMNLVVLMIGMLLLPVWAQQLPEEMIGYPDTILHNGIVLTMDRDDANFTVAQAVAIRKAEIIAVGDNARILRLAGPKTQKIDLQGKALMPGVIDTHSHPEGAGKSHFQSEFRDKLGAMDLYKRASISMIEWNDRAAALAKLQAAVDTAKPGQWVITNVGHEIEPGSPPNAKALKADFDKIAPNNPVAFLQSTTHAVLNSRALEILLKHYKDMPGIFKDESGKPTGYLFGGARGALDEILPSPPPDLFITAQKKELEERAAQGVTTISTRLAADDMTTYAHLDRQGEMPIRIAYTHQIGWWNPMPERSLKNLGGLQNHGTDMLWLTGISPAPPDDAPDSEGGTCSAAPKLRLIVTDAVAKELTIGDKTKTVVSKDLYPEGPGLCRWRQPGGEVSEAAVLAANRLGYRIAGVHTFGDEGIGDMLDSFEKGDKDRPVAGRRFAIDHTMMVSPEIINQAAKLGIIWSVQPQMAEGPRSDLTAMTYGETIANQWFQPTKSIMKAGMMVTYGADTHGDRARPMFGMEYLVTRKNHRGVVYAPQETVDRATALLMMTRWGAYYIERENKLGTIEKGKLADLIVLDKNPLDPKVPDDQLSDIKVLFTLVNGKTIFAEAQFARSVGLQPVGYQGQFATR